MDGEAWWATVHGVAKSQTRLSDFTSLEPPKQDYNKCKRDFYRQKTQEKKKISKILNN